jgi:uncharacterized protein YgbK (DUF1537 family)
MNDDAQLLALPVLKVDPADVAAKVAESGRVLVVLDDDPTGTQSISDLPVLTRWEVSDFTWAFGRGAAAVYVLTNTRSLDPGSAADRNAEIVRNALTAAAPLDLSVGFVSRSDSTLRGHFPLETDVIAATVQEVTGTDVDAVVLVPAFPEAGRITLNGVHYMRSEDELTPIAETEFARDATFGYRNSDLRAWVAEKTGSRVPADQVLVCDLRTIRRGPAAVAEIFSRARGGQPVVADAVVEDDMLTLALGLEIAESRGANLLYRVGPPFVRARIGQPQRPPLSSEEVYGGAGPTTGGLIVVGSHVGLTTRQLDTLQREHPGAVTIELDVATLIEPSLAVDHIEQTVAAIGAALDRTDVIVHTSRLLVKTNDPDESLAISRSVSSGVVAVVNKVLHSHPLRFVIAKGGITSSDVAAYGLEINHAIVRGPMLPGLVSLWEPTDGPAAGIPYVVFAGNVGDERSLADVVGTLTAFPAIDSPDNPTQPPPPTRRSP